MTAMTEPVGRKDETYYWFDNVEFLVGDVRFWLPQYPFHNGSKHFVETYGISPGDAQDRPEGVVKLEGVTAAQFQTFIKLLLPVQLLSTTITFTKDEWLTILSLATLWHFHEARKLAIQHLDGQLTELELITVGRAEFVPSWVLAGYMSVVRRPKGVTISGKEANAIAGHDYMAIHRLWTIRYQLAVSDSEDVLDDGFVEREVLSQFKEELEELTTTSLGHRAKMDIEEDELAAEERGILEEQEKVVAELAEAERVQEAERLELARLAADELAAKEQARLREEASARRYEQRLRLEEEVSSLQRIAAECIETSRGTARKVQEARNCKGCKRRTLALQKAATEMEAEAATLEAEVIRVAREEDQNREMDEDMYLGGAQPVWLEAEESAPAGDLPIS